MSGFWRALVAVLIGNAVYFLLLYPYLPPGARHQHHRLDWGVAVDFWVCLVIWGTLKLLQRLRARQ